MGKRKYEAAPISAEAQQAAALVRRGIEHALGEMGPAASQKDLARLLGIREMSISEWKRGRFSRPQLASVLAWWQGGQMAERTPLIALVAGELPPFDPAAYQGRPSERHDGQVLKVRIRADSIKAAKQRVAKLLPDGAFVLRKSHAGGGRGGVGVGIKTVYVGLSGDDVPPELAARIGKIAVSFAIA